MGKAYTISSTSGGQNMYQLRSTIYCSRWIAPGEFYLCFLCREKCPKRIDIKFRHSWSWKGMEAWRWEKSLLIEQIKNKIKGTGFFPVIRLKINYFTSRPQFFRILEDCLSIVADYRCSKIWIFSTVAVD